MGGGASKKKKSSPVISPAAAPTATTAAPLTTTTNVAAVQPANQNNKIAGEQTSGAPDPLLGVKCRVAINGFGRIGRLLLRLIIMREISSVDIVVINDPFLTPDNMAYIFSHDTVHGKFPGSVSSEGTNLIIRYKPPKKAGSSAEEGSSEEVLYSFPTICVRDPIQAKWGELGIQWVLETSGAFNSKEKATAHLTAGAGKVLITAPADGCDVYVFGVNQDKYTKDQRIISNASCTTNCLAPMCAVLNEKYGIVRGLMTTVHSITATQKTVDGPSGKQWRDGRAAAGNIIPSSTGAAKVIGKIIPELEGKLTGMSFRVPTLDVSVVDLTVVLQKPAKYEDIMAAFREASKGKYKGIIDTTNEDVVSADFVGYPASTIVDEKAGIALDSTFVKLVAWYDNEWGYSNRVIDMLVHAIKTDLKH